ncbi:MAG: signal peptidase I [Dehalococcoidia bacterium]
MGDAAAQRSTATVAGRQRRAKLMTVREVVETAILAVLIFGVVRALVQNFRVEGASMDPTYASGQYVIVNKAIYARLDLGPLTDALSFIGSGDAGRHVFRGPRRGEVVVFHPPLPGSAERDFIKRVMGLPGDHVQVRDNRVFVNGLEVQEPYLGGTPTYCGGQWCDVRLGDDEYYVMGDNRTNSSDSRLWGPIHADKIIGKTWLIYLPASDFGPAPNQAPNLVEPAADTAPRTPRAPGVVITPAVPPRP